MALLLACIAPLGRGWLGSAVAWYPTGWWANPGLDFLSRFTENASFAQLLLYTCRKKNHPLDELSVRLGTAG